MFTRRLVIPSNRFHPIRIILNNVKWGLMDNKFLGEEALRNSGQEYCIIRPGGLTGGDGQRAAKSPAGTDHIVAAGPEGDVGKTHSIHRTDVASVVVASLASADAKNKTVELVSRPRKDEDPAFDAWVSGLFATIPQPNL